jgi:hypothetical protein
MLILFLQNFDKTRFNQHGACLKFRRQGDDINAEDKNNVPVFDGISLLRSIACKNSVVKSKNLSTDCFLDYLITICL